MTGEESYFDLSGVRRQTPEEIEEMKAAYARMGISWARMAEMEEEERHESFLDMMEELALEGGC